MEVKKLLTGIVPPERAFPRMTMSGRTFSWSTQSILKKEIVCSRGLKTRVKESLV